MSGPAPILTVDGIRALEARLGTTGLMERAGAAAAAVARDMASARRGPVVVLAGPGNNGGDGFVVARLLAQSFFDVVTVFRGDPTRFPDDAAAAYAALRASGAATVSAPPTGIVPALVVDALFGIGLKRAPAAEYAELIEWARACPAPVLALDVPSGLDADTGAAFTPTVRADATATFIAIKPGLCTGAGIDFAGGVTLHTLGVAIDEADNPGRLLTWPTLADALPRVLRRASRDVHKGTFGTLAVIGGSDGMTGAPVLAGRAALRTGAGKVRVGFAAREHPHVDWGAPELMLATADGALGLPADAIVAGPGLGTGAHARALVARVLGAAVPLVLDADALNLIAIDDVLRDAARSRTAPTLVTPHPAEAARLLRCESAAVAADRVEAARAIARDLRAFTVLKGAGSVLATPDGAFDINGTGGPALSAAGSGDVLAGMLGALLAQRIAPRDALRYATCLHGAAADRLVADGTGPVGVGASELADSARTLINEAARPLR